MSAVAPTIEALFTQRLVAQRDASPRTIAAYRDPLRLLLAFAYDRTGIPPPQLDISDVDAALIGAFRNHLERSAATACAPATPGSPPSARCSATPPYAIPNTLS